MTIQHDVEPATETGPKNGRATTSLVLGILSLLVNPLAITTVLGIVFGVLGLRSAARLGGRGKALTGIVLSVVGFFTGIVLFIVLMTAMAASAGSTAASAEGPAAAAVESAAPAADAEETTADDGADEAVPVEDTAVEEADAEEVAEEESAADVPIEYASALIKAQMYVDTMHMSRRGLYDQLTSEYGEQFSKKAAKYATKHVDADWKANALVKAKSYQEDMAMSPAAVRDQLTSSYGEQFTEAQADYAIEHLDD